MFGCIEGLRAKALCSVIQCSAVLRGSLFGVCHCSKLRFVNLISIKAYYYSRPSSVNADLFGQNFLSPL